MMEIKVGKYYKTRDGCKAYVGYEIDGYRFFLGHLEGDKCYTSGRWKLCGSCHDATDMPLNEDLVAPWEEQEEIDVSQMWVAVYEDKAGGLWGKTPHKDKRDTFKDYKNRFIVAQVTVKDWQDIQQGKRKLKIGEGL